jgi:hypothetical protein
MKQFMLVLVVALLAFGLGWGLRGRKTAAAASDLLNIQMFNHAFTDVALDETVVEEIDSGKIDDAKHMLRLNQDGNILQLDTLVASERMSEEEIAALRDFNAQMQSSYGGMRKMADKSLARVARHRAEHPWNYTGSLPASTNAEAGAKIDSILKLASESSNKTK